MSADIDDIVVTLPFVSNYIITLNGVEAEELMVPSARGEDCDIPDLPLFDGSQ
jgi:hypothetical protein